MLTNPSRPILAARMSKPGHAPLTPEEFTEIRRLLNEYGGLRFGPDSRGAVERKLRERLLATGNSSFGGYLQLIIGDAEELAEAVEACTVNETYAFRQEGQLRAFRERILPEFRERKRISIWSAGCATGEEAYTIAAIVLDSGLFAQDRVRVFGTDISKRCIACARRGVYSASSFRGTDSTVYDQYFLQNDDRTRIVAPALRSICSFRQGNLLRLEDSSTLGNVDVVFCRNVLIHLDDASRRRAIDCFHERLSPGGVLLLGHSESLLNEETPFQAVELLGDIVYRRPSIDDLIRTKRRRGPV